MKNLFIVKSKAIFLAILTGLIVMSSSTAFSGTPKTYDIQMLKLINTIEAR